ncbi:rRNA biogenesis protein RRP36 [Neolecta irregularis DAH-3]|uniref:rRNA biogenesis protein RRP36 n=1 Tax=Neolecta irregularis (strain DAH-3) TaxID=1198029 RepID=A0A1U7LWV5_NEOID|nr:rRNA biogenesis protein RRP36 [Neolecta irregularis DAH-3]|eukprot:OLL27160.1 rRNA biogenesis protein RRP36 [Neolecta irregularis DAH-3]
MTLKSAAPRSSKHAPMETSSKKPQPRRRQAVHVPKIERRDPRFDSSSAQVEDNRHTKNYAFLQEYQKTEIEMIRKQIKQTKIPEERDRLQNTLRSMESRQKAREDKNRAEEILREQKAKERELVKNGKKPFFLKKSDQKMLILQDKFNYLQGTSALEKALERRRKKNSSKEKRRLPYSRPQ